MRIVSVELATSTFQRGDLSQAHLISCVLFGDGRFSWDVLGQYGNLSSATILFILHEWLTSKTLRSGQYGLAATFGPGFSAEVLLQWN